LKLKKNGKNFQQKNINKKEIIGRIIKNNFFLLNNIGKFFNTNFKPSAKGWSKPRKETFFGPFRF